MKLNENYALGEALEITKLAIQNGYLPKTNDPKQTAKHAHDYYKTLYLLFTDPDNQKDQ